MRNFFRFWNFGFAWMDSKERRRRDVLRNMRSAQSFANRRRRSSKKASQQEKPVTQEN